jgi:transposase
VASWIPPEHLLDLRARVRLRHTLVDQRGEWQQRIQAVLYHHGFPQRRGLLTAENRAWLQNLELPATAREQIAVALSMIDALNAQSAPITKELRLYARRQPGCRALMKHYGIGELTAVTILAELGDARRFSSSRHAVRYAGLDITVHQSDQRRARGHLSRKGRRRCAGRCSRPPRPPAVPAAPTAATTTRPPTVSAATAPVWPWRASCSSAASTPCAN